MKILSLLPSVTEIICEIGAENYLVGITHECDFPQNLEKPKVTSAKINSSYSSKEIDDLVRSQLDNTGTLYTLDMNLLRRLQPDIIFTQELCTVCAVGYATVLDAVNSLENKPEVVNIEPKNLTDVLNSILQIGELCGKIHETESLISNLKNRLSALKIISDEEKIKPKAMFLEWLVPPFCAGHWIPELLEFAGTIPISSNKAGYSTQLKWENIIELDFDVLIISLCGFPVSRAMQDVEQSKELKILLHQKPDLRVIIFDGNHYFSRPSHRLVESAELLNSAIKGFPTNNVKSTAPFPYEIYK